MKRLFAVVLAAFAMIVAAPLAFSTSAQAGIAPENRAMTVSATKAEKAMDASMSKPMAMPSKSKSSKSSKPAKHSSKAAPAAKKEKAAAAEKPAAAPAEHKSTHKKHHSKPTTTPKPTGGLPNADAGK